MVAQCQNWLQVAVGGIRPASWTGSGCSHLGALGVDGAATRAQRRGASTCAVYDPAVVQVATAWDKASAAASVLSVVFAAVAIFIAIRANSSARSMVARGRTIDFLLGQLAEIAVLIPLRQVSPDGYQGQRRESQHR